MAQKIRCTTMAVLASILVGIATQSFWLGAATFAALGAIMMAVLE
jgi:hypothetical protein